MHKTGFVNRRPPNCRESAFRSTKRRLSERSRDRNRCGGVLETIFVELCAKRPLRVALIQQEATWASPRSTVAAATRQYHQNRARAPGAAESSHRRKAHGPALAPPTMMDEFRGGQIPAPEGRRTEEGLLARGLSKKSVEPEEDDAIMRLVGKHGTSAGPSSRRSSTRRSRVSERQAVSHKMAQPPRPGD